MPLKPARIRNGLEIILLVATVPCTGVCCRVARYTGSRYLAGISGMTFNNLYNRVSVHARISQVTALEYRDFFA